MNSGLFGFWLPPSPIRRRSNAMAGQGLRRTGRFGSVTGFLEPAPSPKPRQKPKILAAHRYIFSVNALAIGRRNFLLLLPQTIRAHPVRSLGRELGFKVFLHLNPFTAVGNLAAPTANAQKFLEVMQTPEKLPRGKMHP